MKGRDILILIMLIFLVIFIFAVFAVVIYAAYNLFGQPSECVGVIYINGPLSTASSSGGLLSEGTIGSDEIANQIKSANDRNEVKAVVFEINSPGGSVVASREIYEEIKALNKPKVAYFREVAASGGYYVAVGTDYIISDPDAITGSIGVIAIFEDLSGLFQKLGINYTIIKSGELKDLGSQSKPLNEKEKAIVEGIVNETFNEFKSVVESGRAGKLDTKKFNEILDARILTGRQAKNIGLVDELGNKKDALRKAAEMANITYKDVPRICEMKESNPLDVFFGQIARSIASVLKDTGINKVEKVSLEYR
jgi:protease-4